MKLNEENINAIAMLRLEKAKKALLEAEEVIELGHWRAVAKCLYNACYYAVSALLFQKGITIRTHSGVMNQLESYVIKEGFISVEQSKLYDRLFGLHQIRDYDEWINLEEKDVIPLIEPVEKFVAEMENFVNSKTF